MQAYRIDREEEAIAQVQTYLRAISYLHAEVPHIGIDGIYGEETKEAVRAFQALYGQEPNGIVDATTFTLLYLTYLKVPRKFPKK